MFSLFISNLLFMFREHHQYNEQNQQCQVHVTLFFPISQHKIPTDISLPKKISCKLSNSKIQGPANKNDSPTEIMIQFKIGF